MTAITICSDFGVPKNNNAGHGPGTYQRNWSSPRNWGPASRYYATIFARGSDHLFDRVQYRPGSGAFNIQRNKFLRGVADDCVIVFNCAGHWSFNCGGSGVWIVSCP